MDGQSGKQTLLTFLQRTITPLSIERKAELLKKEAEDAENGLAFTKNIIEYEKRIAVAKIEKAKLLELNKRQKQNKGK